MIPIDIQILIATIVSMIPLVVMIYKDKTDDGAWLGLYVYHFMKEFRK